MIVRVLREARRRRGSAGAGYLPYPTSLFSRVSRSAHSASAASAARRATRSAVPCARSCSGITGPRPRGRGPGVAGGSHSRCSGGTVTVCRLQARVRADEMTDEYLDRGDDDRHRGRSKEMPSRSSRPSGGRRDMSETHPMVGDTQPSTAPKRGRHSNVTKGERAPPPTEAGHLHHADRGRGCLTRHRGNTSGEPTPADTMFPERSNARPPASR